MTDLLTKNSDEAVCYKRIIKTINGKLSGPVVVFFGGIHGNEMAGNIAINKVLNDLDEEKINGTIYGISGNIKALKANKRFIENDLNRLWTKTQIKGLFQNPNLKNEEAEQLEIYELLQNIIAFHQGPFYFIDFHTTSSKTIPFITINDALINRKFSSFFPVPKVLGIEEYLSGPLLSYINELGYVSLGFESGQHSDEASIAHSVAFIYLTLVYTLTLKVGEVKDFSKYVRQLETAARCNNTTYEVTYRHKIEDGEIFKMKPGFKSFELVDKHTEIATSNHKIIKLKNKETLFMPLYQKIGEDGYYLIKPISPFILRCSAALRKFKFDNLLVCLPGVSWFDKPNGVLIANTKITKVLAKQLFHLLGYRSRQISENQIKLTNRERVSKANMYKGLLWYKFRA
ncbi:succinylglutamate desuccinylase/aspartoacylase family protein [Paucihalobacter sp.]|uniref:succinylglutamate desuccinylase/aspartoacylase family protein n=1 Tax=Paucihalobacter sp. TaxID=2850405 RepID=UPI002FE1670E